MTKTKKRICTALAALALTAAFAILLWASDKTSNINGKEFSHTKWVGPGYSCHYKGAFGSSVPSGGAVYKVDTKSKGNMITQRQSKNTTFDGVRRTEQYLLARNHSIRLDSS